MTDAAQEVPESRLVVNGEDRRLLTTFRGWPSCMISESGLANRRGRSRRSESPINQALTRSEYIIASVDICWSRTRRPSTLVRQQLKWESEKRRLQRISLDIVEAERVGGGKLSASRSFICERTCLASGIEESHTK